MSKKNEIINLINNPTPTKDQYKKAFKDMRFGLSILNMIPKKIRIKIINGISDEKTKQILQDERIVSLFIGNFLRGFFKKLR